LYFPFNCQKIWTNGTTTFHLKSLDTYTQNNIWCWFLLRGYKYWAKVIIFFSSISLFLWTILHVYFNLCMIYYKLKQQWDIDMISVHGCFVIPSDQITVLAWMHRNLDNISEWSGMSTYGLLFQWTSTKKIQLSVFGLVQSGHHHHFIEFNLFSPWYNWKISHLAI